MPGDQIGDPSDDAHVGVIDKETLLFPYTKQLVNNLLYVPKFNGNIWYVNASVVASGDGTEPGQDFKTIGEAIAVYAAGDSIKVKFGTYIEDVTIALDGIDFCGEYNIGVVGTVTVSGDGCRVTGVVALPAAAVGFAVSGNRNELLSCKVSGTPTIAFQISGIQNYVELPRCDSYTVTGYDISNNRNQIFRGLAQGGGAAVRGFYFSNAAADFCQLGECTSLGNTISGYHIVTGITGVDIINSHSGPNDGRWIDEDGVNSWPNFTFDNELHNLITFAGAPTTYNMYKVTGTVRVEDVFGTVETQIANTSSRIHLELFSVGGTVAITKAVAAPDIDSLVVGSALIRNEDSTNVIALASAATPAIVESSKDPKVPLEIIADKDQDTFIRANITVALASGAIDWHVHWEPLSDDGFVEAV